MFKLRLLPVLALTCGLLASPLFGQDHQPPGVSEALAGITSEHGTHTSVTFDRDMLESMTSAFGAAPVAGLNSITFENYRYHEPAFYIPENMHAIIAAFNAAGWMHLVDQNAGPKESTTPTKPLTDLWMHFDGMNIDHVTVLIRAPKQMNVIEVTGVLKPLDLVHLSGHFGIPKVDPGAVMVPAPPGK